MNLNRLIGLMEDWAVYMKLDSHRLGYPSRSSYFSTGGSSTTAFEDMVQEADNKNTKIINAIVHSLPIEQREAIYARWTGSKKPMYYELKLQLATDKILELASKRIY